MENIDDFMRRKFDPDPDKPGRFEFREEFWEQAQALLEADERRRRKRRRWLLWWLFAGLLLAVGAWAVWQTAGDRGAGAGLQPVAADNSGKTGQALKPLIKEQEGGSATGTLPTSGNGELPAARNKDIFSTGNNAGQNSSFEKNDTGNQIFKQEKNLTPHPHSPENALGKNSGGADRNAVSQSGKVSPGGSIQPVEQYSLGQNDAAGKTTYTEQAPLHDAAPQVDSLSVVYIKKTDDPNDANHPDAALPALPILPLFLTIPGRDVELPSATPFARRIEPLRERRLNVGLFATASLYRPSPDGRRLGGAAGLFAAYHLSPVWSLSAGAMWRFLPGDWSEPSDSTTSKQLRYSFGYQSDTWQLEPRGLHFAEFPLGLKWHRGAFGAEGGVAAGMLIGAQGRLTKVHSESLQPASTTKRSQVWMDKAPYRSGYIAVFAGAEWRAFQWLGLSLQGSWRPGSLLKTPSDFPVPGNIYRLDAGLRFYLFKT